MYIQKAFQKRILHLTCQADVLEGQLTTKGPDEKLRYESRGLHKKGRHMDSRKDLLLLKKKAK